MLCFDVDCPSKGSYIQKLGFWKVGCMTGLYQQKVNPLKRSEMTVLLRGELWAEEAGHWGVVCKSIFPSPAVLFVVCFLQP